MCDCVRVCLSARMFVCLVVCFFGCVCVFGCLLVRVKACVCVRLFVCLFVCSSMCLLVRLCVWFVACLFACWLVYLLVRLVLLFFAVVIVWAGSIDRVFVSLCVCSYYRVFVRLVCVVVYSCVCECWLLMCCVLVVHLCVWLLGWLAACLCIRVLAGSSSWFCLRSFNFCVNVLVCLFACSFGCLVVCLLVRSFVRFSACFLNRLLACLSVC